MRARRSAVLAAAALLAGCGPERPGRPAGGPGGQDDGGEVDGRQDDGGGGAAPDGAATPDDDPAPPTDGGAGEGEGEGRDRAGEGEGEGEGEDEGEGEGGPSGVDDGPPFLRAVRPAEGPLPGGIAVELLGGGLLRTQRARIGGRVAAIRERASHRLSVSLPAGEPGPAEVAVEVDGKEVVLTGAFRYLGPAADGDLSDWRAGWWSAPPGAESDLPGASLQALAAVSDGRFLHVGIQGVVTPDVAVVGYVDLDPGAGTGAKDMDAIDPGGGQLDQALSCPLVTGSPGLGAELGFGTAGAWSAPPEGAGQAGWRDIADPGRVRWLPGPLSYHLGARSLETSVELPRAGVASEIALTVRLVTLDGARLSNQTLPPDDPGRPGVWNVSYRVAVPGR